MYICNCNGIRERDVHQAIEAGAERPSEVFQHCNAHPVCAKCIRDMLGVMNSSQEAMRHAAQ